MTSMRVEGGTARSPAGPDRSPSSSGALRASTGLRRVAVPTTIRVADGTIRLGGASSAPHREPPSGSLAASTSARLAGLPSGPLDRSAEARLAGPFAPRSPAHGSAGRESPTSPASGVATARWSATWGARGGRATPRSRAARSAGPSSRSASRGARRSGRGRRSGRCPGSRSGSVGGSCGPSRCRGTSGGYRRAKRRWRTTPHARRCRSAPGTAPDASCGVATTTPCRRSRGVAPSRAAPLPTRHARLRHHERHRVGSRRPRAPRSQARSSP